MKPDREVVHGSSKNVILLQHVCFKGERETTRLPKFAKVQLNHKDEMLQRTDTTSTLHTDL